MGFVFWFGFICLEFGFVVVFWLLGVSFCLFCFDVCCLLVGVCLVGFDLICV